MKSHHSIILFLTACTVTTIGCAATDASPPDNSEQQSIEITKELFDALSNDELSILILVEPWPDNFLPSSGSYEECVNLATPFTNLGENLLLQALQVCERRHPAEP